ncbi:MAG: spore coat protein [Peptococcaceae bacterium]|nr:spore coat protein [Peptococcaceae bacterium]
MPHHQQVSPVCIAIDCLNSTKYLAQLDTKGVLEASTPQLKQAFSRMNQDHVAMADEWFRLMNSRGWYQVAQARPETVTQAMSHLQTVISQTQGWPAQAVQQQYQPAQGTWTQFR